MRACVFEAGYVEIRWRRCLQDLIGREIWEKGLTDPAIEHEPPMMRMFIMMVACFVWKHRA
eukprot:6899226-Pyramimonas_sp.AAC.1